MKFSERYGYLKPSEVIIREKITPDIQNAICNCLYNFKEEIGIIYFNTIEEYIWCYFLNQQKESFSSSKGAVIKTYIQSPVGVWYEKLDIIEAIFSLEYGDHMQFAINDFVKSLNSEFERLNFAYRIVKNQIVEITSEHDIEAVESAIENNKDNVRMHLSNALKLFAQRPVPDYRNSIKESITAVEALNRQITGEKVLNFKRMEDAGIKIPSVLRLGFEKLYAYTNDPTTGIRHALMDETAEYVPEAEEALFMLVSCSAFINYLSSKKT